MYFFRNGLILKRIKNFQKFKNKMLKLRLDLKISN